MIDTTRYITGCFDGCPFFHTKSEYDGGFSCTISDADVEGWSTSELYLENHATAGPPPDCPARQGPLTFVVKGSTPATPEEKMRADEDAWYAEFRTFVAKLMAR